MGKVEFAVTGWLNKRASKINSKLALVKNLILGQGAMSRSLAEESYGDMCFGWQNTLRGLARRLPDLSGLCVWGCHVWVHDPDISKLDVLWDYCRVEPLKLQTESSRKSGWRAWEKVGVAIRMCPMCAN